MVMSAADPTMSMQRLRLRETDRWPACDPRFRGTRDSLEELIMISDCSSEITMNLPSNSSADPSADVAGP